MADVSPVLELAVRLIAEGWDIPAFLCDAPPFNHHDIARCRLGAGMINSNGGEFEIEREGVAVCIAYDVRQKVATSRTTAMPVRVHPGQRVVVGPLAFGKNGVPDR